VAPLNPKRAPSGSVIGREYEVRIRHFNDYHYRNISNPEDSGPLRDVQKWLVTAPWQQPKVISQGDTAVKRNVIKLI
jgi:hypothetical protein